MKKDHKIKCRKCGKIFVSDIKLFIHLIEEHKIDRLKDDPL
jgi:hypothetical protein